MKRLFVADTEGEPWQTLSKLACQGLSVDVEGDFKLQKSLCEDIKPQADTFEVTTLEVGTEVGKAAGLCVHFGDYKIGSYANGTHSIFVAFHDIEALIRPEYHAMFSGNRSRNCLPNDLYEEVDQ